MNSVSSLTETDVAGTFIPCADPLVVEFCGVRGFSIWVNGRFVREKFPFEKCIYFTNDDICRYTKRDTVFMTIVSDDGLEGLTSRSITISKTQDEESTPSKREFKSEFWQIGFVVISFIVVFTGIFFKRDFFRFPRHTFSQSDRLLTVSNFILLIVICLLGAFIWTYSQNSDAIHLLSVFFYLLIWWVAKTLLTLLSGSLFRFNSQAIWQCKFLLQFWMLSFILLLVIVLFCDLFLAEKVIQNSETRVILSILEGLMVLVIGVFFVLERGVKKLHRFVYLCTTEILPGVLIIQFFLK